jgi:hypothetical protein
VIYWRHHAAATAVTWTDPVGYTKIADITILATTAFRQLAVWVQDFPGSATGQTVSATSNNSGDGIHGVIVLQEAGGAATNPKGPFTHPLHGPFRGPIS